MTLRDAIDKDNFYIENISYSDDDLKAMSIDGLETLKMRITKKISGLSLSLKEKQNDGFSNNGQKRALYLNERVLDYVNFLIKNHRQKKQSLEHYFLEHARQVLPPMLFAQILAVAELSVKEGN